jgi:hypothetical protein
MVHFAHGEFFMLGGCKAGQIARDERARAVVTLDIAFGEQVLIRQNH